MKQLIVISDWVNDTLRNQEMRSTIMGFLRDNTSCQISFISSSPSSLHASYLINQVVTTEERYGKPLETVIFADLVSPNLSDKVEDKLSEVQQFFCVRLQSGIMILGVQRGCLFSLLAEKIARVFTYSFESKPKTFAARDLYAKIGAYFMDAMEDELELEEAPLHVISRFEGCFVGHIDISGVIKTTIKESQISAIYSLEEEIPVTIGSYTCLARYLNDEYSDFDGALLYPGSSGDPTDPFMELKPNANQMQLLPKYVMRIDDHLIKPGMSITVPDVC